MPRLTVTLFHKHINPEYTCREEQKEKKKKEKKVKVYQCLQDIPTRHYTYIIIFFFFAVGISLKP